MHLPEDPAYTSRRMRTLWAWFRVVCAVGIIVLIPVTGFKRGWEDWVWFGLGTVALVRGIRDIAQARHRRTGYPAPN